MGHEQYGELRFIPQRQQLVLHAGARERVERSERLVHEQYIRLHGHAARDGDALLHAAGEGVRVAVRELGEIDLLDVVHRPLFGGLGIERSRRLEREVTFSSTVFHGSSWSNSWNTIIRSGPGLVISSPFKRISPSVGCR